MTRFVEKYYLLLLSLWIIAGNLFVTLTGIIDYGFDSGIYWLPEYAFKENFFHNLWHLHTNPPLLNFVAGMLVMLHIPLSLFCNIAFPVLQIAAAVSFTRFLRDRNIKHYRLISFVLLANPLHFIWFHFYYYPALMFSTCIVVLQLLYSGRNPQKKFWWLCFILSMLCMMRASYHPLWIILLLIPFCRIVGNRNFLTGLLFFLLPLTWFTKNYFQFGFWGSSSLAGQNISAHYPDNLRHEISNFNSRGRYKLPFEYAGIYDENDKRIKKYYGDKLLTDSLTLHNVRTVVISEGYAKETAAHWSVRYSLLTIAYGTFSFFGSPAIDEYNNKSENTFTWNNTCLIDWLDLPNIKVHSSNGGYSVIRLSWYTLFYPLAVLILFYNYRQLSFNEKFILLWIMITGIIYCTVDPNEAARMRYETEPFFWWMMLVASTYFFKANPLRFRKESQKDILK